MGLFPASFQYFSISQAHAVLYRPANKTGETAETQVPKERTAPTPAGPRTESGENPGQRRYAPCPFSCFHCGGELRSSSFSNDFSARKAKKEPRTRMCEALGVSGAAPPRYKDKPRLSAQKAGSHAQGVRGRSVLDVRKAPQNAAREVLQHPKRLPLRPSGRR